MKIVDTHSSMFVASPEQAAAAESAAPVEGGALGLTGEALQVDLGTVRASQPITQPELVPVDRSGGADVRTENLAAVSQKVAEYGAPISFNARTILFDLYAIMAIIQETMQQLRNSQRDLRKDEIVAIQNSIVAQAKEQRQQATKQFVVSIVMAGVALACVIVPTLVQGIKSFRMKRKAGEGVFSKKAGDIEKMYKEEFPLEEKNKAAAAAEKNVANESVEVKKNGVDNAASKKSEEYIEMDAVDGREDAQATEKKRIDENSKVEEKKIEVKEEVKEDIKEDIKEENEILRNDENLKETNENPLQKKAFKKDPLTFLSEQNIDAKNSKLSSSVKSDGSFESQSSSRLESSKEKALEISNERIDNENVDKVKLNNSEELDSKEKVTPEGDVKDSEEPEKGTKEALEEAQREYREAYEAERDASKYEGNWFQRHVYNNSEAHTRTEAKLEEARGKLGKALENRINEIDGMAPGEPRKEAVRGLKSDFIKMRKSCSESAKAYVNADKKFGWLALAAVLPQAINGATQSIAMFASAGNQSQRTLLESAQKREEENLDQSKDLFANEQQVIQEALRLFQQVTEKESQSVEAIIQGIKA